MSPLLFFFFFFSSLQISNTNIVLSYCSSRFFVIQTFSLCIYLEQHMHCAHPSKIDSDFHEKEKRSARAHRSLNCRMAEERIIPPPRVCTISRARARPTSCVACARSRKHKSASMQPAPSRPLRALPPDT